MIGEFRFSTLPDWLDFTMEEVGGLKVSGGGRKVAVLLAVGVAGENISCGLKGVGGKGFLNGYCWYKLE